MKHTFKALARFFSSESGPSIRVAFTPHAGRGVFATRNIGAGELIHTADPLVAHPWLHNLSKTCFMCLKRFTHGFPPKDAPSHANGAHNHVLGTRTRQLEPSFCSQHCSDSAKAFYTIEQKADWDGFHRFCSEEGLRQPLLAKRFVCMVLSGRVSVDALDILSYVKPSRDVASCWMHTRTMLLDALKGSGVTAEQLAFISDEWYCGVLARLSLNTFRVELLAEDTSNLLAAAAASVSGNAISGSAVYIVPSMYNHDCDPNVHISWPSDATAHLNARRDIEQGEELRITYIDASMSRPSRQHLLKQAYYFECTCSRCKDED